MPERDSRRPAGYYTSRINALEIAREPGSKGSAHAQNVTQELRKELAEKGIKGFKRGGKVKKTGVYKLHKGEKVITAKVASKKSPPSRGAKKK